jgi:hypothetical protein
MSSKHRPFLSLKHIMVGVIGFDVSQFQGKISGRPDSVEVYFRYRICFIREPQQETIK